MRTVDAAGLTIGDPSRPRIMGVLNLSVESPYRPSVHQDPGEAARYVDERLIDEGADIVDVGLASANRRLEVLSADEELERLDLAVDVIASVGGDAVFSIETRYAAVAEAALDAGFDMVNDVCGFADPAMASTCEDHDAAVVKMASPPDIHRPGALGSVDEVYAALERGGLTAKTIVDPAFGRWSDDQSLGLDDETFVRLEEFAALDRPILASINRKNFLRKPLGRSTEDALPASLAATALAVERGVSVLRTHDVRATRDAARVGARLGRHRIGTGGLESDAERAMEVGPEQEGGLGSGTEPETDPESEPDATTPIDIDPITLPTRRTAERHLAALDDDPSLAGRFVHRAVRIAGLSSAERSALAMAVDAVDGLVVAGSGPVLLAGTSAAMGRLVEREITGAERLRDVLGRIEEHAR